MNSLRQCFLEETSWRRDNKDFMEPDSQLTLNSRNNCNHERESKGYNATDFLIVYLDLKQNSEDNGAN